MIRRMRFFRKFVVANGRNRKFGSRGKPARKKLKENGSREARKGETERISLAGCPQTPNAGRDDSREARKRNSEGKRLAGSPKMKFRRKDARGKPARKIPKDWRSREARRKVS